MCSRTGASSYGVSFSPPPYALVGRADTPPPTLHRTQRGSEGFQGGQDSSQAQPLSLTGLTPIGGPLATPATQLIVLCDFLEYSQPPLPSHAQRWVWRRHSESEHKCFPAYLNVTEATVVNWPPHTSFHLPECARVTSNS